MRRVRLHLLGVLVVCWASIGLSWAVEGCGDLVMQGTWKPIAGGQQPQEAVWKPRGGGFRIAVPPGMRGEWLLQREEQLPEDGWIIDWWGVRHGTFHDLDVQIEIGIGEPYREGQGYLYKPADHVCWVRLSYNAAAKKLSITENGLPVEVWPDEISIPTGPVAIRVMAQGPSEHERFADLCGFTVQPWSAPLRPLNAGRAFRGWTSEPTRQVLLDAAELPEALRSLTTAPDAVPNTRAAAIAARAVYDYAVAGAVSVDTWNLVEWFATEGGRDHIEAVSIMLPMVVACATTERREQMAPWLDDAFTQLDETRRVPGSLNRDATFQRMLLIDPVRAVATAIGARYLPGDIERWCAEIHHLDTGLEFGLRRIYMGQDPLDRMVWMLPEINGASPDFAKMVIEYMLTYGADLTASGQKCDGLRSKAAYRIADLYPGAAMELWEQIKDPSVSAEALEFMAPRMGGDAPEGTEAKVEECLQRAIDEFEPTKRNDSPVPEMIRLAEWYHAHGRTHDAGQTTGLAIARVGEQLNTRFRDTFALAKLLRELGDERWQDLWRTAVETAKKTDTEHSGPESGGGMVYVAPTFLIVRDLVRRGEVEQALEIAGSLDPVTCQENRSLCFAMVARHLADVDIDRAMELLEQVGPGRNQGSLVVSLIPKVAPIDRDKAVELMMLLPEKVHEVWTYRIAVAAGDPPSAELTQLHGKLLEREVCALPSRGDKFAARGKALRQLEELAPAQVLAVEDYLSTDQELYARVLLACVVRWSGLGDDPLWTMFAEAGEFRSRSDPSGVTHLSDAVRADESNKEND